MQDDMEQGAVDLQPTVVVNKTQLSEPVHEETDPRAGRADPVSYTHLDVYKRQLHSYATVRARRAVHVGSIVCANWRGY